MRAKGYAAIQDELDYGIVSVSLPIFAPSGRLVAAANCSDVTNRLDRDTMIKERLPVLRQAVRRIEGMLAQYPELTNSVTAVGSDYLRLPAVARVRPAGWRPAAEPPRQPWPRGDPQRVERAAKAVAFVSPLPSSHREHVVHRRRVDPLDVAARPADVDPIDARRVSQADVHAQVALAQVAASGLDLAHLRAAAGGTLTRAPMPSRLLRVPTARTITALPRVGGLVVQQLRRRAVVGDQQIHAAVVVHVGGDQRSVRRRRRRSLGPASRADLLEAPAGGVPQQQLALRMGGAGPEHAPCCRSRGR